MAGAATRAAVANALMSLHLVFCCSEWEPDLTAGGIARHVDQLALGLLHLGCTVTILRERSPSRTWAHQGLRIVDWAVPRLIRRLPAARRLAGSFGLSRLFRREPTTLVECSQTEGWLYARCLSARGVVRVHGLLAGRSHSQGSSTRVHVSQTLRERTAIAQARYRVAVSEFIRLETERWLDRVKVEEVVPNFVDTSQFSPGAPGGGASQTIFYHGSLKLSKGVLELAEAVNRLWEEGWRGNVEFAGVDRWAPEFHAMTSELLRDRIAPEVRPGLRLLGRLGSTALVERLRSAWICVYPSPYEAFGLACLEAMAVGKPVVCVADATREFVLHEVSGLVARSCAPAALAEQMSRYYRDPGLASSTGRMARRVATEQYDSNRGVTVNLGLYSRLAQAWGKTTDGVRSFA